MLQVDSLYSVADQVRARLVSIISIPGAGDCNEIIMPQLSYSDTLMASTYFLSQRWRPLCPPLTIVSPAVPEFHNSEKMSGLGFKYSCQSSHLYIMPVKRGYKIDGRDQTGDTDWTKTSELENKSFQHFLSTIEVVREVSFPAYECRGWNEP